MEPTRILYVHGGKLSYGGTEAYMMNYCRRFDKKKLQVDFIVHGFEHGVYDDEIEAMGGTVYHVPVKSKDYLGNLKALREIFSSGKYNIVHSHMDAMNAVVLKQAKKCGIPVRISHSHNTQHLTQNKLKLLLNDYEKKQIKKVATDFMACSDLAGDWLYDKTPYTVLNNAIETDNFRFEPARREQMREQLGLEGCFVVGHIGRFHFQKNHDFLLEVFQSLHRAHPETALLLVGDGERRGEIEQKVAALGLKNSVVMTGNRSDVPDLLQAMDVFLFPSLFEGLPVTLVEAQASGMPCIIADTITPKTAITDCVRFMKLELSPAKWAEAVWNAHGVPRTDRIAEVKAAGYDAQEQADRLQRFYLQKAQEAEKS